jgi:hypothetical protein
MGHPPNNVPNYTWPPAFCQLSTKRELAFFSRPQVCYNKNKLSHAFISFFAPEQDIMTEQTAWTTLWVDSMDRQDWQARVQEAFALDGVEEVQFDPSNGEVRVRYDVTQIRPMHLHSHLRAAGL